MNLRMVSNRNFFFPGGSTVFSEAMLDSGRVFLLSYMQYQFTCSAKFPLQTNNGKEHVHFPKPPERVAILFPGYWETSDSNWPLEEKFFDVSQGIVVFVFRLPKIHLSSHPTRLQMHHREKKRQKKHIYTRFPLGLKTWGFWSRDGWQVFYIIYLWCSPHPLKRQSQ